MARVLSHLESPFLSRNVWGHPEASILVQLHPARSRFIHLDLDLSNLISIDDGRSPHTYVERGGLNESQDSDHEPAPIHVNPEPHPLQGHLAYKKLPIPLGLS